MASNVDSCGLLIGFLDNCSGGSVENLFKAEFQQGIFPGYKIGVAKNSGELDDDLYRPVGYYLFGDYDMAFFALIDDFAFPNRVLHAGHGYRKNGDGGAYKLQIINGIHVGGKQVLKDLALETFHAPIPLPFVSIVNYKVSDGLLIGTGEALLERLRAKLRQLGSEQGDIKMICIDSFSNSELVVIYFSDKISALSEITNASRCVRFGDLDDLDDLAKKTFLYQSNLKKDPNEDIDGLVKDSHVFSTSFSRMGYAMEARDAGMFGNEDLSFLYQWDIKPGHGIDCEKILQGIFKGTQLNITPGVNSTVQLEEKMTFCKFWEKKAVLEKQNDLRRHIRKQRVCVLLPIEQCDGKPNDASHPLLGMLSEWQFKREELVEIRRCLESCGVSKVLREQTLKMFSTFNNAISDLLFFGSFIEVRGYLLGVQRDIKGYKEKFEKQKQCGCTSQEENMLLGEFHEWLNPVIQNYEQIYYNRFHHSSKVLDLFDFNLGYNGGIQQLISAYDIAYDRVIRVYEDGEKVRMDGDRVVRKVEEKEEKVTGNNVYVSGYERANTDKFSLRINISHITYPELYATIIWKEAANFSLKEGKAENNFFLPQSECYSSSFDLAKINLVKIKEIKRNIFLDDRFDGGIYAHSILIKSINEALFSYLKSDIFVYDIGFGGDIKTFEFWYWSYFMQMSHFYNIDGTIQEDVFIKFMARWLMVRYLEHGDAQWSNVDELYRAFDPLLAEVWNCHIKDVVSFVRILVKELDKTAFWENTKGKSQLILYGEKLNEGRREELDNFVRDMRLEQDAYVRAFSDGSTIVLHEDKLKALFSARNIMYAYLKYVHRLIEGDAKNRAKRVLGREQGEIVKNEKYNAIVADPSGGMFIYQTAIREDYFRARAIFYKALWDMNYRLKMGMCFPESHS